MKASDIVAIPLQLGSAVRQRRVFHPLGVLASGRIERTAPPEEGLPIQSADVLGRVSKAIGLPGRLPDLIGLAWRMPPVEVSASPWDVLMVSAGSGPLTRLALRPTLSWTGTTLSTLMPLQRQDGTWWLKAELVSQLEAGLSLETVREAIGADGIAFEIQQARGSGSFSPLAKLTFTAVVPTNDEYDLSFDPTVHTGSGVDLRPSWLTKLRKRAYMRSRRGRAAPDEPDPNIA